MGKLIAGLLCGTFYGAFFLWVAQRADERKRTDRMYARGMERLRTSVREFDAREKRKYVRPDILPCPAEELVKLDEGCSCDECCDCGAEPKLYVEYGQCSGSWPIQHETLYYEGPIKA